ncbi:hypothetical protein Tco_1452367 [Tanacetum coccineum]
MYRMELQCKEKKRAKDSIWFKDKMMLAQAKEARVTLDAKAKAFLADQDADFDEAYIDDTNNSNVVTYAEYLKDNEVATKILQNDISSVQPDNMILMFVIDTMKNQVTICNKAIDENRIANELLTAKLERYKEKAKWIKPSLHDGNEIEKHVHAPTVVRDSEETLKLADESKAKMKERMSDPIDEK